MHGFRLLVGSAVVLLSGSYASATPLTCEQYRSRLSGALTGLGPDAAAIDGFTLAFDNPQRGKRYNWASAELRGGLSCGPADQFQEFTAQLSFGKKETFAAAIKSFTDVSGASVCGLATETPADCKEFSRVMIKTGLELMGRAYSRGNTNPSGLVTRDVVPGARAQFTAAPSLIGFAVGPGPGSAVEDVAQGFTAAPKPDASTTAAP